MKTKKGFTLLELLVVVVIIGILAAIALPQYRLAVGKSQYSTLKNITKSLSESMERYYLAHNSYPKKFEDLDVDLVITSQSTSSTEEFVIYGNNFHCELWYDGGFAICIKKIAKTIMRYKQFVYSRSKYCEAYSYDTNDIPNRICQAETGKTASQASCKNSRCDYRY